jgi:hypothetical protein
MFGERWKEPFKKWFEDNYKLPVKTIVSILMKILIKENQYKNY